MLFSKNKKNLIYNGRPAIGSISTPINKNRSKPWYRKKRTYWASFVLVLIGSLILAWPYIPGLIFKVRRPTIATNTLDKAASQGQKVSVDKPDDPLAAPGNRLIMPSIGVNAPIIEGKNIYVIGKNQGAWHEAGSAPADNGNLVLAAHRFLYTATNGGYFYHLTELKNGDALFVKWDDKVYKYEVYNTRDVWPTQVDIRDTDTQVPKKLTLYTCTPLGSTAKRHVVEAKQL